ncbi:MAG TPA: recombinase family protein, partial [Symbiobacteriaceae bacterium]|nr:recombinase family protein [Symbiobacteriaceae bacterium]
MNVAAIYRVSTERQVRRDGEESLPVQRTAVRQFVAGRPGWTLVREYAEEGVSGFKRSAEERDVLQAALRDARAGQWQALVVFKADRLSRNAFEYPVVIDRFRRLGVVVWSVTEGLLALDTQMDKFIRFLEGWQAETE